MVRMGKKMAGMLVVGAVLAAGTSAVNAAVIAQWTFETSVPTTSGPLAPEIGAGSATSNTGGTFTNPAGNGTVESWSSSGWNSGEYFQFTFASTGYTGLNLVFDQTGSNTGPKDFKVQIDTGSGYSDLGSGTYALTNDSWSSATYNSTSTRTFSLPNSTVGVRLTNYTTTAISSASPVAAGGTGRVDNVTINGTLASASPTINLANSTTAGYSNVAEGGEVDLVVDANTIVESEIDPLTVNSAKGEVLLSPAPPTIMSEVYVLLWLVDTDTNNATTIDGLVDALDTTTIISDNSGDADTVALQSAWDFFQTTEYAGFNVIVRFDTPGAFSYVNWDFAGFPDILVDQIAVIPEPASLGVLALGGLALLGRRRK